MLSFNRRLGWRARRRLLSRARVLHSRVGERPVSGADPSPDQKIATDRKGSIARGRLGWKLPVSRHAASRPRERRLSPRPDTQFDRGERPLIELHRLFSQKIAADRKWSIAPCRPTFATDSCTPEAGGQSTSDRLRGRSEGWMQWRPSGALVFGGSAIANRAVVGLVSVGACAFGFPVTQAADEGEPD